MMRMPLVLIATAVMAVGTGVSGAGTKLASPNATHACLIHEGVSVRYMSAAESVGSLGDLLATFSPTQYAQLSFERSNGAAKKGSRVANQESRILNIYAGAYPIRNVSVSWKTRPSPAEKTAIRSCIKP